MDFISSIKKKELRVALGRRKEGPILVTGPTGCGKSYVIHKTTMELGLSVQYIENLETFNGIFVTRNTIGLVDLDDYDKIKPLKKMPNLIIESRNINPKNFSISVSLNKITDTKIKKICKDVRLIDGNLHRLNNYKWLQRIEPRINFFHTLGKIFYYNNEKEESVQDIMMYVRKHDIHKIMNYVFENYFVFLSLSDQMKIIDNMSMLDHRSINEEYLEYIIISIMKANKKKPNSFFGFKPINCDNKIFY
ncbi:hypothetical protein TCON_1340 [Astathelohania contejeani]|uniref:Checkpoint protein RAD24-like helical bundle domain-containing protein n=1 Tax=Astathelohania contejeani TaxID=164912 RepID=A0ABQ7HZ25_9MICR|nr:hypothetical protein TCON_1340 [Thelohania contejeani]